MLWVLLSIYNTNNKPYTKNCQTNTGISSSIPGFAMNAHGNLAQQNREFGPYRGLETGAEAAEQPAATPPRQAEKLVAEKGCTACHQRDKALVGPAFLAVAQKYAGEAEARAYLANKIRAGGSGVWGGVMPPQAQVDKGEAEEIADWLLSMPGQTN